jgi:hypothetical protein
MASKVQERIYAERAIKLLAADWTLSNIPEPLDFEARAGSYRFGLEVRQVFAGGEKTYGSPLRRNESINDGLIYSLAEQYYAAGGRPITAQVLGNLSKADIEQTAQRMSAGAPLLPWDSTAFHLNEMQVYMTTLPSSLDRYSRWTVVGDHVGWAREITRDELQAAVERKKRNLALYKAKYSDIDLLLVADRIFNSGRLVQADGITIDNPGFRNVYFMSYPESVHRVG